jgi:hypothetical protein
MHMQADTPVFQGTSQARDVQYDAATYIITVWRCQNRDTKHGTVT